MNKIQELKIFIEAAEMFGGEDWTPTPDQWRKIRAKIMALPADSPPLPTPAPYIPHMSPVAEYPSSALFDDSTAPAPSVPPAPVRFSSSMALDPDTPTKPKLLPDGRPDPNAFK